MTEQRERTKYHSHPHPLAGAHIKREERSENVEILYVAEITTDSARRIAVGELRTANLHYVYAISNLRGRK